MEPAPELIALIQQYYRASARGDTAFLAEFVARDAGTIVIGTDNADLYTIRQRDTVRGSGAA